MLGNKEEKIKINKKVEDKNAIKEDDDEEIDPEDKLF